ncbi:MAG TPA: DUF2723 domain-containing protein [Roseiflexaceae bacterium]|nr:DUF2723 domain-containing protein [Roseiflexaceae bacterium]
MQQSRKPLASGLSVPARGVAGALWAGLRARLDLVVAAALALAAFALYAATLLSGVGGGDTAEFQRVGPTLGLAHPSGYPLYTLLGWLWSLLPLGGTPAWRMNLLSAALAALALAVLYACGRALGQRPPAAAGAVAALGVSLTFWSQATIAEVYALALLLQALLFLALLRWRAGRLPLWPAALAAGLALAHHLTVLLLLPGVALFLLLGRAERRAAAPPPARPSPRLLTPLCLVLPLLLYLYIPLRAPAWLSSWAQMAEYASGAGMAADWLDPARLLAEGPGRLLDLAGRFVWPQLLPAGALLALLGALRLLRRDRAAAALLLPGYALVFAFCAAYYVADVEVFLLPAHLIAALLLGQGIEHVRWTIDDRRSAGSDHTSRHIPSSSARLRIADGAVRITHYALPLLIPALLLWRNVGPVRALNEPVFERAARAALEQPAEPGALLLGDWQISEALRYLQTVEGLRPDMAFAATVSRPFVQKALEGRPVYLLAPAPELGLAQRPAGALWQVGVEPLADSAVTPADQGWRDRVRLTGFTLPPGPYRPGDPVPLTLVWQSDSAPSRGYTLFVHLVDADGRIWGQQDRPPVAPTERWQPGERYADLFTPALAPDAPPGRYRVNIGWYTFPELQRLLLADTDADYVTVGEIEVLR